LTHIDVKNLLQLLGFFVQVRINLNSPKSTSLMCMETLTVQDIQKLLHAIEELHSLHDLGSFGAKALAIVHQLVPSEIPHLHITNFQSCSESRIYLPGHSGFPAVIDEVMRHHFTEHPIVQNMPLALRNVCKVSDFISWEQLQKLEGFYQQCLRVAGCREQMTLFLSDPQPQSWYQLAQQNASLVGISLNCSRRNFTERDRLILNLLRPHLAQAYQNARHYHQIQQNLTQLHQSLDRLGLIIVNTSGQIQLMTSQATQCLQNYFAKPINSQLPDFLWAWVKYQISSIEKSDSQEACLPLRVEHAGKQLVIRLVIESDKDRYLLLIEEQVLSLLPALNLLGLSSRETEILFWVIRGKDNQAIAQQLSLSLSTVRKHLESIFRKLGVHSRTEAIAQALDKLGILTSLSTV